MRDWLSHRWPAWTLPANQTPLLALDLETTGLRPGADEIVSMGWLLLDDQRVAVQSARHVYVQPSRAISPQSVTIHGIGDDAAAGGVPLAQALEWLLKDLAGRVLVGHHVRMDAAFVAAASRTVARTALRLPCIDTLSLLHREARRRQQPIVPGSLTLSAARAARGLGVYPAHDALSDALAAAELWLSLCAEFDRGRQPVPLSSVVELCP